MFSRTWDHVFQGWSPEGSRFLGELGMGSSGVTWYDVLGLLPGATAEQVQRQYDSKARLLRPELVAGAPSPVVTAASRAQEILDGARRVLADPVSRVRYDQAVGIRRSGGGLARRGGFPSQPGSELLDVEFIAGNLGSEALGALLALTNWLTPHPRQPGHGAVPDVRGLFYSVCLGITGKLGLRVTAVRLTEHPVPVDGLVVDQSPRSPVKIRQGRALTVQVWHPPVRSAHPG
jgi:DnaJ domain